MTTYKLLKKYPSLPRNWEEGMRVYLKDECFYRPDLTQKYIPKQLCRDEVENYPEFWEKVIIKKYEILSYSDYERKAIATVKRLSDGEIFTVGDNVDITNAFPPKVENQRIRALKEDRGGYILVSISDEFDKKYFDGEGCNLSIVSHAKKVLFTTEDEVDVYKGDKVWHLPGLGGIPYEMAAECRQNGFKFFSTKEKAGEYITMNKPCLSINDVLVLGQWNPIETKTSFMDELKKIVEKKGMIEDVFEAVLTLMRYDHKCSRCKEVHEKVSHICDECMEELQGYLDQ